MGWCWLGRTGCQKVPSPPLPSPTRVTPAGDRPLFPLCPVRCRFPQPPSPKCPSWAARGSLRPEGPRGGEKRYGPNGKTNIWSGRGGTIDSFLMISVSPALPASPGHWKLKSLLDQGWPGFDSATSVPHKKFTCGPRGRCSST